jgi:hypothetical protein
MLVSWNWFNPNIAITCADSTASDKIEGVLRHLHYNWSFCHPKSTRKPDRFKKFFTKHCSFLEQGWRKIMLDTLTTILLKSPEQRRIGGTTSWRRTKRNWQNWSSQSRSEVPAVNFMHLQHPILPRECVFHTHSLLHNTHTGYCWIAQSGLQSSFCISIQIQKQSYFLSRNQKLMVNLAPAIKPSYFLSTSVLHLISWLIKICLLGILCLKHIFKILLMFAAFHFFTSSWIVIGFGWIVNPF